jgi:hypothetical protein
MEKAPFDAQEKYVGVDADAFGGMTPTGTMIRDAQVFGLIPETENCTGWTRGQLQILYDETSKAWAPFGHLVRNLTPDLRDRHERIHGKAIEQARTMGWSPVLGDDD